MSTVRVQTARTVKIIGQSINICAIVCGRIKGAGVPIYACIWHCTLGLPSANMRVNEIMALPARGSQCHAYENTGTFDIPRT